ncbi:MAG: YitT family protein [Bacilli bacterium]|nr:YitT family protein [Bacilli bacterium]
MIGKEDILTKIENKQLGKKFFLLILGTLIGAFAFNIFYGPYNVVPTGSTGLAFILIQFIKIDISTMTLIVNSLLLLTGLFVYKKEYAAKYLLITIIFPVFLKATSLITSQIDLENTSLFLIMVFGGTISGLSSGLIRKSNFTPGGFSVIFDILNDKLHISIGSASAIINLTMIAISSFTFGLNNALYAVIAMIVASYVMDKIIIGISNKKVFYIITKEPDIIKDCIIDKFHYTVTIIKTKNGIRKKRMLMCVIPTIEYIELKEAIKKLDPNAFFLIVDTYDSSVKKNCKNM